MADAINPLSSLYPQPPQASGNLLTGDPSKVIGVLNALNQNALQQQQIRANTGVENLYKGEAIGPDGQPNHSVLMGRLPTLGINAPAVASTLQEQQAKRLDIRNTQTMQAANLFGSLANVDKLTPSMVHEVAARAAALFPDIDPKVISDMHTAILKDPAGIKHGAALLQNLGLGPAGQTARGAAPPTPSGAQQQAPMGSLNLAGTTPTGISPREVAAQTTAGSGAGSAVNDARIHGLNYTQQVFPLEQAIPALEKLGKTGTGPGTDEFNQVKSFLQSAGVPGFDSEKIKTFDEAKKYLTDFVNQNGNSGTNDKLAASFAGNPSVHISNAAAADVAKSALTLRRMRQAQLIAFEKSGKPDEEYPKEAGKWNREHDPRAYGFDLMTPDQRKKVLEDLPKGKRELFMLDVQDAVQHGIIKAPK